MGIVKYMNSFLFLLREIVNGKSVIRAFLNNRLTTEMLEGKILDLGSGGNDRYSEIIPKSQASTYELFDQKIGNRVNFEKDPLPYGSGTFDTILLLNVLEHIYNYKYFLTEIRRIKKSDGVFIGFVPFLMWYHMDPHDYFRYTHEALEEILSETGYTNIRVEKIYFGPYIAAFQMIHTTLPTLLRIPLFLIAYGFDLVFRKIRAKGAERYVIGYYFKAH